MLKFVLLFIICVISVQAQHDLATEFRLNLSEYEEVRVVTKADGYLKESPITITSSSSPLSAGGKHDFFSQSDYWWPNPEYLDSPYVRKDGMTNPNNFVEHRRAMIRFSIHVPTLVAAYKITRNEKYAVKAIEHIKAWFVDEDTKMNPHLKYAQAVIGRSTGRGVGIIDAIHLVEVAQSIIILEKK